MGFYINPMRQPKEQWLEERTIRRLAGPPRWVDVRNGELPVCLVNNGAFTAAAIAYSESELAVFADTADNRPKKWYMVAISDLVAVTPSLKEVVTT